MSNLFSPLQLRDITLRNRVAISPMCQYSSEDGYANDWHLVHLGSRAVGGAGLIISEATAVEARGRISPQDLGIWQDAHIEGLARIVRFIHTQGAAAGIQLAHAGRKASTRRPWEGRGAVLPEQGGWADIVGPGPEKFDDDYPTPRALDASGIAQVVVAFRAAAHRALDAGFRVIELHAAHGYLLHEFYSPLSNHRTDEYGGSFENRIRLTLDCVKAIREVWPEHYPLLMRISSTDWLEGGWDIEQSVALACAVKPLGVDLVDCSSGGNSLKAVVPVAPGYQVPFAARIRHEAGIRTGAVGIITQPEQAEEIIAAGEADLVLLGREVLRDPYWPLHAAYVLADDTIQWPSQYLRAKPTR
jgi:2,4-dienoyl-CoA reductase-like NADH-dependent reductase (Old Yellow Enzyme family)